MSRKTSIKVRMKKLWRAVCNEETLIGQIGSGILIFVCLAMVIYATGILGLMIGIGDVK